MPVTFGTVQVVAPTTQGGATPGGSGGSANGDAPAAAGPSPAPRPRELVPVMRQLRDRAARLRAH